MRRPLVDGDWLEAHLDDPRLVIAEVSSQKASSAEYSVAHIPGARFVYWKDLCWKELVRDFPTSEEMAARLGRLGVGDDTTLVLVGDPIQFSTYAYWVMTMTGFEHLALVLDGGRDLWIREGRPTTDRVPEVTPADPPRPGVSSVECRIGRDEVLAGLGSPTRMLLDLRSREEYLGLRVSPATLEFDHGAERAGHIPGARHLPYDRLLTEDGRFKPTDQLAAEFDGLDLDDREVVTYCRLSHRASLGWFVLTRLLGRSNVRVYDGSWTEWGSMVGMPIVAGEDP
jgi:thiosulfate/3-mercaptopyruvate sulfurtransferase